MPLEVTLAPRNGHGSIPREIPARLQGALPLTRRAIAAMARYLGAETEDDRDRVQAWARLAEPERWALDRLAGNLARCGERRRWAETSMAGAIGFVLTEVVRHSLLEGLALAARDVEAFVRALGAMPNRGTEVALLAELPARCVDLPAPVEAGGGSGPSAPLPEEAEEAEEARPRPNLRERLAEAIEVKGLDLALPIDEAQKVDLAALVGSTPGSVAQAITKLRRERGIATPGRYQRCRASPGAAVLPAVRVGPVPGMGDGSWGMVDGGEDAASVPINHQPSTIPHPPAVSPAASVVVEEEARAQVIRLVDELLEAALEREVGPLVEAPIRGLIQWAFPELLCPP